jgi:glucokinase
MNDAAAALGIDIGSTRIKAVAVQPGGEVIARRIVPSADNVETLIATIVALVGEMATGATAVGISAPGLASRDNRSIAWMRGRMEAVEGLDWSSRLSRIVWVLNDGHAAAVGENWLGAARGVTHAILLTLGTGVGGGIIVDGRVLQGATGRAGHVGHITLDGRGKPDIVGMPGSLEDAIGNHNIAARSRGRFTSTAALLEAVSTADEVATQCWQTSIRDLAVGVASLVNAFDPEVVVLGGGIAECDAALFVPLQRELDQVEWRPTGAGVPVVPAQLGEFAGAIGAARFAMLKNGEELPR